MLEAQLWSSASSVSDSLPQNDAGPADATLPSAGTAADDGAAPLASEDGDREDSATLFIPPELYERLMVTPRRPGAPAESASSEHTLASAQAPGAPPQPSSSEAARAAEPRSAWGTPTETGVCAPAPQDAPSHVPAPSADVPFAMASATVEPKVTANGTMLMHAMPYLVGQQLRPAAPPPPSAAAETASAPDSARVRRALDEMSMVIDIQSMSRKLASASQEELARYVDVLRRSEGLPEAATAQPAQLAPQGPPPAYGYGAAQAYPQHPQAPNHPVPGYGPGYGPQPGGWAPPQAAAPPWVHPQPPQPSAAPVAAPSAPKPVKRAGAATAMFAVMFVLTLLGVGAVTYVALRGGDLAVSAAAATQPAPQ